MKLLEPVCDKLRFLHYALETKKSYLGWIERELPTDVRPWALVGSSTRFREVNKF